MANIKAFHLLNDYSGSPKVLKNILLGLLKHQNQIVLYTSDGGVLDEIGINANYSKYSVAYSFNRMNIFLTLLRLIGANIKYFWIALKTKKNDSTIIYINTIMPWGAAIGASLRGIKVIYHYHENAYAKSLQYQLYAWIMEHLADVIICVSKSQASFLKRKRNVMVVPNAIPEELKRKLSPNISNAFERQRILMLSSLKDYKGTKEFCQLAQSLSNYSFELVINDTAENVTDFLNANGFTNIPNLIVNSIQKDVSKFYNRASLVLSLTDKRKFVETFGLTATEAMAAGLPIIVPTVGGISELVTDGYNGYKIDVENLHLIKGKIIEILSSKALYTHLAGNALKESTKYNQDSMIEQIENIIEGIT